MNGQKIYEYDLDITGATDFGVSLQAILSGQEPVPPQDTRIYVAFAGEAKGRLAGRVHGVDYLLVRADGRIGLDRSRAHRRPRSLGILEPLAGAADSSVQLGEIGAPGGPTSMPASASTAWSSEAPDRMAIGVRSVRSASSSACATACTCRQASA